MKTAKLRMRPLLSFAFASALLFSTGCINSPEALNKWANTPDSEALFEKHLLNTNNDDAMRIRSLELLAEQWRYSSKMFRDGLISNIQDDAARERIVAAAIPDIEKRLAATDETTRVYARDALFTIGRQVTSEANAEKINQALAEKWLSAQWSQDTCKQIGGVREAQIFESIGQEKGEAILAAIFDGNNWGNTYCALTNSKGVEWRDDSEVIARSLLGFWDKNLVPDDLKNRVFFLDQLSLYSDKQVVRDWAFTKIQDEDLSPNDRGVMVAILSRSWVPEDLPKYQELLQNKDTYRWEAVRALIAMQAANGLDLALTHLPEDSDYAFWDGARRTDGFKQATDFICAIPQMQGQIEDMRETLQKHAKSGHMYAKAIAVRCLGAIGNDTDAQFLAELKKGLSKPNDASIPFWSREQDATPLSSIIDDSIEKLAERAAAEQPAEQPAQ